jgi:hypothetical protein
LNRKSNPGSLTSWRFEERISSDMPDKKTLERARKDKAEGKAPSTQAGEFVREEMEHIREGKHGAKSTKQAIAIGLNKARAAGVDLNPPAKGRTSEKTRKSAQSAFRKGHSGKKKTSSRRSSAVRGALKKMPKSAASRSALSKQAKSAARKRTASSRSAAAKKAAATRKRAA